MERLSAVSVEDDASVGFLLEPLRATLGFRWVTFGGNRLSDWPLVGETFVARLPLSGSFLDKGSGVFLSIGDVLVAASRIDVSLFAWEKDMVQF
jgi:hypothetical protein